MKVNFLLSFYIANFFINYDHFSQAQVEQHKFAFDVQREKCDSLQKVIEKFQTESEKSSLDRESLAEAKERLEKDVSRVNFELKQLNAREVIRKKTDKYIKICLAGITKCQKSVEKLIVFIRDAISKQFLDPSLLFFTDDGKGYHQFISTSIYS